LAVLVVLSYWTRSYWTDCLWLSSLLLNRLFVTAIALLVSCCADYLWQLALTEMIICDCNRSTRLLLCWLFCLTELIICD
jgi:hypothetical protein